jgi:TonB family protein
MINSSPPRAFLAALILLPLAAAAQANKNSEDYFPKFAREEQRAEVFSFDSCIKPEWPKASLRNEETGTVTIQFTVAANGRLLKHEVVRSSGFALLDRAAAEGLGTCKFRPAMLDGRAVQSVAKMQYVWTLE